MEKMGDIIRWYATIFRTALKCSSQVKLFTSIQVEVVRGRGAETMSYWWWKIVYTGNEQKDYIGPYNRNLMHTRHQGTVTRIWNKNIYLTLERCPQLAVGNDNKQYAIARLD